ncbi:MAG: hypothetical protein LBF89_00565 [Bacteroidales bacterium]|jgi:hypothetical protein|nr:hypothetical protein [Bacteroidales bacterium]
MKKNIILLIFTVVCGSLFYSCTKEEPKSASEVILGRWALGQYSTELEGRTSVELQRLVDTVLYYYARHKVSDDFANIIEFTGSNINVYSTSADNPGSLSYGTYAIAGDSINVTKNDAELTGFPIKSAKIWANGNERIIMSIDIPQYLDLEAISKKVLLTEERMNKLKNGYLILLFERYSPQEE